MRDSRIVKILYFKFQILIAAVVLLSVGCKRDVTEKTIIDNTLYEVAPVKLYLTNADKTKQKTSTQYTSILFADLFHTSIPASSLNVLNESTLSVGDKGIAADLILQTALAAPGVDVPSDATMRSNIPKFVTDTYIRFYLRNPTPYEAYYMKQLIESDPSLTPQMVFAAFALSNEYNFY